MTSSKRTPVLLPILIGLGALAAAGMYLARTRRAELTALGVDLLLERPAKARSYAELAQGLERDGEALQALLNTAPDTAQNRDTLGHIIGIEGWGRAKLAALADGTEPPVGGHHPYKPDPTLSLPALTSVFAQDRARTAEVARRLGLHPPADDLQIRHDQWGPLTARGWLNYLALHARATGWRVRGDT